jgi:hypothetical protein
VSLPPLPRKGAALRLLYIREFGFAPGCESEFLVLLRAARTYAFENGFHFLSLAVDEKDDVMNGLVKGFSRFNFRSHSFSTSLRGQAVFAGLEAPHVTYEDYSLV